MRQLASVLDIDMSCKRYTPFEETAVQRDSAAYVRLPVVAVLPLLESTVNFVVATVKVPPTFRVLCKNTLSHSQGIRHGCCTGNCKHLGELQRQSRRGSTNTGIAEEEATAKL